MTTALEELAEKIAECNRSKYKFAASIFAETQLQEMDVVIHIGYVGCELEVYHWLNESHTAITKHASILAGLKQIKRYLDPSQYKIVKGYIIEADTYNATLNRSSDRQAFGLPLHSTQPAPLLEF